MCGIAGFIGNEKDNNINLKNLGISFCKILDHRGPDDNGLWIDENHKTLLAHTRLSILDLDPRSKQPMIDYKYNLIIVFNVKFSIPRFSTLQLINQVLINKVSLSRFSKIITQINPLSPNLSFNVKQKF